MLKVYKEQMEEARELAYSIIEEQRWGRQIIDKDKIWNKTLQLIRQSWYEGAAIAAYAYDSGDYKTVGYAQLDVLKRELAFRQYEHKERFAHFFELAGNLRCAKCSIKEARHHIHLAPRCPETDKVHDEVLRLIDADTRNFDVCDTVTLSFRVLEDRKKSW